MTNFSNHSLNIIFSWNFSGRCFSLNKFSYLGNKSLVIFRNLLSVNFVKNERKQLTAVLLLPSSELLVHRFEFVMYSMTSNTLLYQQRWLSKENYIREFISISWKRSEHWMRETDFISYLFLFGAMPDAARAELILRKLQNWIFNYAILCLSVTKRRRWQQVFQWKYSVLFEEYLFCT